MENKNRMRIQKQQPGKSKQEKERKSKDGNSQLIMINSATISSTVVFGKILHGFRCT